MIMSRAAHAAAPEKTTRTSTILEKCRGMSDSHYQTVGDFLFCHSLRLFLHWPVGESTAILYDSTQPLVLLSVSKQ